LRKKRKVFFSFSLLLLGVPCCGFSKYQTNFENQEKKGNDCHLKGKIGKERGKLNSICLFICDLSNILIK